jgi:hypothetical protein
MEFAFDRPMRTDDSYSQSGGWEFFSALEEAATCMKSGE